MEVKHLNSFILKNKVKRHDEVKDKLIDLITTMNLIPLNTMVDLFQEQITI